MELFLLWRRGAVAPELVAESFARLFAPLFSTQPEVSIRGNANAALVVLHLPVRGWKRPFFEDEGTRWAQAIDYPLDVTLAVPGDHPLLAAARELERDPAALLAQLSPPFSLIWNTESEIHLQNDGLGQAQLFEYSDGATWAITNHAMALKALGVSLEPVPREWAVHAAIGWFPRDLTGFRNLRRLPPATRVRIDAGGVHHATFDVLDEWLHAEPRTTDEWMEIARASVLDRLRAAATGWDAASTGLSGGWDSRAVVSSLRALNVPFRARVKGRLDSPDVTIATELARLADLTLEVEQSAEMPSSDPADWSRCISLALLWQTGQMDLDKQKTIFANGARFKDGVVNVMGQHGEIGRAFHYGATMREHPGVELPWNDAEVEERFVALLLAKRMPRIRPELRDDVTEILTGAYREAERHRLTGLARLDFFYLYENTRRLNAGSLASQLNLVVAPFLNPDFIRAAFAAAPQQKASYAFHRHIIATNAPEWSGVDYATESLNGRYYDHREIWKRIGTPLIDDALRHGGFWTEVFDEKIARDDPFEFADELVALSLL